MTVTLLEGVMKRLFDLIVSSVSLIFLFPLILAFAVAIKWTSRGPVFFRQERSGLGGRPFRVLKFRTMVMGTKFEKGVETQAGDPRITKVGGWLRHTGLDELPQLLNVLAGQMSIVGPRPLLAWENDLCDQTQRRRLSVRPGLTGLSQIMGRNRIPWDQRVAWDVEYVKRACFRIDLEICLKSVPVVLFGRNAYATASPKSPESLTVRPARQVIAEANLAQDLLQPIAHQSELP